MATIEALQHNGQSVWLDTIDRRLLLDDGLRQLIELGVSGLTSNPTIFQTALKSSDAYDDAIRDLLEMNPAIDAASVYEWLVVRDVQMAADQLRPVYDRSDRREGYVSLEVSPHLAFDTMSTLDAARHLWQSVRRPNLLIKVPATAEGVPAVEQLIAEGINVNATLLFSVRRYEEIALAYLRGQSRCQSPEQVASVASFFVSRIDAKVDAILEAIGKPEALAVRGRTAINLARKAYQNFKLLMQAPLARVPGKRRTQRLLWASTSVKNPAYPATYYLDNLIGLDTVTTVPTQTLEAFFYEGSVRPASLESELDVGAQQLETLESLGVNVETIAGQLEVEGVDKFIASYEDTLGIIADKCSSLSRTGTGVQAATTRQQAG